ncbi:MAG: DUF3857 domain-containing transglutaminase family protein [Candidatus Eisenbacteria bacterium]|uniref:DUF3857 domain-containing transglutaminase family protein n=1 Tax=Eiseniibacteriota bacterium TaxID=2212470 RepID=A0A948RXW9_UNCEI|nr:DUF3857 domain-containing transglutaminase family protein [Candidatus Eisenbacteria bacterium]MBU1951110.1 DUF3857 domain-containing transglutaminase family protein [Candidatus Eisenbacteria bacterium]MBU2692496.1 DUF3857 domain-containing transglutaminase family protein [Candidatus Eisenbacteria bacterium]
MRFLFVILALTLFCGSVHAIDPPANIPSPDALALMSEPSDPIFEEADRILLFDRTTIEVEESGLSHRYHHQFIKILKPAGAVATRALRFDYDTSSNIIEIRSVRIYHADSTTIDVDPETAVDVTAPADLIYWGGRMKVLGLPRLMPGDAVEILTYMKGFQIAYLTEEPSSFTPVASEDSLYIPPMRGHFYDVVLFQGDLPMVEKVYEVRLPRDKPLQYSMYNGDLMSSLRFTDEAFIYRFWSERISAVTYESRMPDLSDFVPKVVMATVENWEDKSRWFYETNEWVFESTPEIDAKVQDIVSAAQSDEDKMALLLHWVAQNIRYSGLNMGAGEGYTIHPSSMTFQDRCGVCKDIAGMLVTMLRSAGFKTYAAMTMAGSRVEDLPADQFNHCVVALETEKGETIMLDPTWAPWNRPIWSRWEGEQNYVIGNPEGDGLSIIPAFDPAENLLTVRNEARISKDGSLNGVFKISGRGISDGGLRNLVAGQLKRDLKQSLERRFGQLSDRIIISDYTLGDHRDFSGDMSIEIKYAIPGYADFIGKDIIFSSPSLTLLAHNPAWSRFAAVPIEPTREHDLFLWAPQLIQIEEKITLPDGFKIEPPENLDRKAEMGAATLEWEAKGPSLHLHGELKIEKRMIPSGLIPELQEVVKALQEQADESLYGTR